jgi:Coenzyme PQQ synthesis protein D (PqqD)
MSERKMLRGRQFTVDPRRVVHETIEGETIMIDLDTGTYYSLRGSGPAIWDLLVEGFADTEVIGAMKRRDGHEVDDVAAETSRLIEQLMDEGLLELAEPGPPTVPATAEARTAPGRFEPPILERYTDMKYFLLLDPIHEVEEGGWPRASAPGGPPATPG